MELRSNPEFIPLMNRDRTHWPRCLLWHGWLPRLTSRTSGSPWAIASSDLASHNLERLWVPTLFLPIPLGTLFWDQDDAHWERRAGYDLHERVILAY